MNRGNVRWKMPIVALLAMVGLALVGTQLRRNGRKGCALDGAAIEPFYRVRIVTADGKSQEFCCILCAELWLAKQQTTPFSILVTDEASGEEVDRARATFVRSKLVTNAATGNRVHVFAGNADGLRHALLFAGKILTPEECPFQGSAP
jgi:hypothetical protein